jgi:type II secretory pathway pseudopilin PulG
MHTARNSAASGVTLIELIVFIVVSGIVALGLVGAFTSLTGRGTQPEHMVEANFLVQQKLEELTKQDFASIAAPDEQTITNYGGRTGYTVHYTVAYIQSNLADSSGGVPTNYKRITVEVTEPAGSVLSYSTLVTKRYRDAPQG